MFDSIQAESDSVARLNAHSDGLGILLEMVGRRRGGGVASLHGVLCVISHGGMYVVVGVVVVVGLGVRWVEAFGEWRS